MRIIIIIFLGLSMGVSQGRGMGRLVSQQHGPGCQQGSGAGLEVGGGTGPEAEQEPARRQSEGTVGAHGAGLPA